EGLPYDPYRTALYTADELFSSFDPNDPCSYCNTLDARIYRHWRSTGRQFPPAVLEALARRLHDHAITEAVERLLGGGRQVVAVMGGHGMGRDHHHYRTVARLSRALSRRGYLLASGGGPG